MKKINLTVILLLVIFPASVFSEAAEYTPPPKLPAYKTPSEKMKQGVKLYDFRTSNIELYRITKSPSAEVRAVAEFEPASLIIMTYFPGYYDKVFRGIVSSVIDVVKIYFFYDTASMKNSIISRLKSWGISDAKISSNVVFVNTGVDSVWTRDSGPNPIVTSDGKYGIIDFRYYSDRYYDDKIPTELANLLSLNVFRPSMDFEGGNFMTNGKGLCMATRGSVWENLPLRDADIQKIFYDYMGCKKTVFLKPLAGEGTTHIDMFAKFTSEDTILLGQYKFAQDCINYNILEENYSILLKTTTVDGKPLKIVRIPMPDNSDGVWRTYTNSLFVNNIALVPVYSQHKTYETEAIEAYKTALGNNWKIITIDSEEIIPDGGAIHCITMTVPDFSLVKFQNDPEPLCGNSINCSPSGCGTITTKGECDGDVVLWCESNAPNFYDCSSPCNMVPNGYPCEQRCEYNNQSGYYDCISDFQCLQCIDECKTGEKGCKDSNTQWVCAGDTDQDGCNEIKTINCNPGETCRNGICQSECTPDCTGKECGDDGCGNACGFCKQNEYCGSDSKCHPNPLDAGTDTSDIKDANTEDIISDITPVDTTDDINSIKDAEGDTFLTDSGNDTITTDIIDNDVSDTGQTDITDAAGHDTGNIDASVRDTIRIDSESEEDKENNTVDNSEGCSCSFIN